MAPSDKKTLREIALKTNETNPSQLGDPISLKAEAADSNPTDQDLGASSPSSSCSSSSTSALKQNIKDTAPAPTEGDYNGKAEGKGGNTGEPTLRQKALRKLEENPSQLGDPVSLKAETVDSSPTWEDRGAGWKGVKSKL